MEKINFYKYGKALFEYYAKLQIEFEGDLKSKIKSLL